MKLKKKVEEVRTRLVKMGMEKGLQDPGVMKLSQHLDRLIIQSYKQKSLEEDRKNKGCSLS